MTPGQIMAGVALWQTTKAFITATGVAVALCLFPETRTWGLIAGGRVRGLHRHRLRRRRSRRGRRLARTENSFPTIQRFVITPLFLFAGAFYPIEQLPDWLQTVAKVTPIWHGVELCRDSVNGRARAGQHARARRLPARCSPSSAGCWRAGRSPSGWRTDDRSPSCPCGSCRRRSSRRAVRSGCSSGCGSSTDAGGWTHRRHRVLRAAVLPAVDPRRLRRAGRRRRVRGRR